MRRRLGGLLFVVAGCGGGGAERPPLGGAAGAAAPGGAAGSRAVGGRGGVGGAGGPSAAPLAFPGAQGFAKKVTGGRTEPFHARFQPVAGFQGLASFAFEVAGSDGTSASAQVTVLVAR